MHDTVASKCPHCGMEVPVSSTGGVCPHCAADFLQASQTEISGEDGSRPTFTPPTAAELAPHFPQLEILELLGRGGMGAVYKARQPAIDRVIALKILPPGIGNDPAFAERFSREARALAKLNHPGIVTLYEFGHTPRGLYYFLMEFVDGVNLRELLESKPVPPREALAIVPQICDALQFAHDQGIVHRDIKPENILLDRRGRVKVADFGLAKLMGTGDEPAAGGTAAGSSSLTDAGKVMGTPQYMAPERMEHPTEVDHRADIYALGVVFYQLLTGELPDKKLQPPSRRVQIDVRLDEVVLRALEKKPEHRYQQASAFKTQVETISAASAKPESRSPGSASPSLTRFQSLTLIAVDILVGLLLALVGWTANESGMFFNALYVFIMFLVPVRVFLILWHVFRGTLEYRLWRTPRARELRPYRWQVLNGWIFWLLAALTLKTCIVPAQFSTDELTLIHVIVWGGIAAIIVLGLLPGKRIFVATNLAFMAGSVFMAVQLARIHSPAPKAEAVVLAAPFRGEWLVVQGGWSTLINHHYGITDQRDALDIERVVKGKERTGPQNKLTSYPSWGETLYAPADGKIAVLVNDLDDNPIGQTDEENVAGNHISLDIGGGRFVLMAHLQKGSALVAPGDVVHAGQPIAKCGNSGNTTGPHLHIQVQSGPRIFVTGNTVRTYPILFRDVTCMRDQRPRSDSPFSVRRNDCIICEQALKLAPVFSQVTNAPNLNP